jgi:hypothetical protein
MAGRVGAQAKWVALAAILVTLGPSVPAGIGAPHGSVAFRHGLMRPHRHIDGSLVQTQEAIAQTTNWAGYVVSQFNSGTPYTAAQGSWVVPRVAFAGAGSAHMEFSANWVGIGGTCGDANCDASSQDTTLIQLGTESDANPGGGTDYYAWYEMLPMGSMTLMNNPVSPGDVMTASLQCVASCSETTQSWTLSMVDQTQGWTFTQTFSYASSELSAEWIEEAPSGDNNTVLALADFGQSTFNATSANGVSPQLNLSLDGIQMDDATGMAAGQTANPSQPSPGDAFSVCWNVGPGFAPCAFSGAAPQVAPQLASAVLPSSRSVEIGRTATAFTTIINTGSAPAESCTIEPDVAFQGQFLFQTTNPTTNVLTGSPNVPATIPAGGSQSFVIALTPEAVLSPTTLDFSYSCQGDLPAAALTGVNTLAFSASATPVPDVIALASTVSNDGTLHIGAGDGAFAMASINAGATGALTVTVNTGDNAVPVALSLCQTDPTTAQCLAPPAASVAVTINANATPTFSVFATAEGAIPFSPGVSRIFVQFTDAGNAVRGSTSVAVTTQ